MGYSVWTAYLGGVAIFSSMAGLLWVLQEKYGHKGLAIALAYAVVLGFVGLHHEMCTTAHRTSRKNYLILSALFLLPVGLLGVGAAPWFAALGLIIASVGFLFRFGRPEYLVPLVVGFLLLGWDGIPHLVSADSISGMRKGLFILVGGVLLGGAFFWERYFRRRHSDWAYTLGVIAFWGGISSLDSSTEVDYFLFFLFNTALIAFGVIQNRRIFLVFGGLGIFAYFGHLAWDVFQGSLVFPIVLGAIGGIAILLPAILSALTKSTKRRGH